MAAVVMSPTPALPTLRKASVWDKMFSSFKASNNKKQEEAEVDDFLMPSTMEKRRCMSTTTGADRTNVVVQRRTQSNATRAASIAPSIRSTKTTASRAGSVSSNMSRRSSKKWWRSSNPEDEDAPPVPAIDSKFTIGSSNPEFEPVSVISAAPRKSYTPRNAAGSFLKTTTQTKMKVSTEEDLNEVNRQLESKVSTSSLKPIEIKGIELRKDSHVALEKNGLFSMAGICDIIEDVDEEQHQAEEPLSPMSNRTFADSFRTYNTMTNERTDSAKGSPELLALKDEAQREPSFLDATVA